MTRSSQSAYSPKIAKKAFKKEAKAHGLEFHKVVQARVDLLKENNKPIPGVVPPKRRNMGRQDGVQWTGDSFICSARVDGTREDDQEIPADVAEQREDETRQSRQQQTIETGPSTIVVSLLDIARPAKRKGVHKQFEVLESAASRVITLEDFSVADDDDGSEAWSLLSDSDSSDLSDDESLVDICPSRSYASVLRRH